MNYFKRLVIIIFSMECEKQYFGENLQRALRVGCGGPFYDE